MEARKKIQVDGVFYWVYRYKTSSRSNYNTMFCVRKIGDSLPICGTTGKETDHISDYIDWSIKRVRLYNGEMGDTL